MAASNKLPSPLLHQSLSFRSPEQFSLSANFKEEQLVDKQNEQCKNKKCK